MCELDHIVRYFPNQSINVYRVQLTQQRNRFLFYFLSGNDVVFLNKPKFTRTLATTTIIGCSYRSSKNIDLSTSSFLLMGEERFQLNSTSADESNSTVPQLFSLSNYTFSHFVKNGTFRCLVQVGAESFLSNSSMMYENPSELFEYFPFIF